MGKAQKNKRFFFLSQKKGDQQNKPLETPIKKEEHKPLETPIKKHKKQQNKTPTKAQNETENKPAVEAKPNDPSKKKKKRIRNREIFFNPESEYQDNKIGFLKHTQKSEKSKQPNKSQRNRTQSKPPRKAVKTATPSSKGKSGNASQPRRKEKKIPASKGIEKKAQRKGRNLLGIKYSAAGVILYSKRPDNTVVFLLGEEDRSEKTKDCKNVWLNFGGKIEKGETSASQTALRELIEETGGLFTEQEIEVIKSNLTNEKCPQFSIPFGKYVLFFVECPYDQTVPQRFKELGGKNAKSTQTELMWCDAKSVLEGVAEQREYFISRNENGEERKHTFYPFFARLLNYPQVREFLKTLLAI